MKPRPAVIHSAHVLAMPIDRCAPAIPPSAPASNRAWYCSTRGSRPAANAATGFSPTARTASPQRVEKSAHQTATATGTAAYTRASWTNSAGPSTGRPARPGTAISGSPAIGRPMYGAPTSALRPTPQNSSASPVASWLARRSTTSQAKSALKAAPASAAASTPAAALPVFTVVANPATAPTSITPSRPRLTIPARWPMTSASVA